MFFAPSAHAATTCSPPTGEGQFQRATPEQVDLDRAKIDSAVRFMVSRLAFSVQVYRHGCLAASGGLSRRTQRERFNVMSTTKGVLALLTGRAITQGKLGLDDPIGRHLPEADAEHGRITVRQLLTQTSGLRYAALSEGVAGDAVGYTLRLPFAHAPGTYFEYAQTPVTLLGAVVQRAVGLDLQAYAQRELFEPLGIPRRHWTWTRDRRRQTQGYAHLYLPPMDLGRIGQFLLQEGEWNGTQIIDRDYMRELRASTPTNPGYGFLTWTNEGDRWITPTGPSRRVINEPFFVPMPRDTYAFLGAMGQNLFVVPSLDMVIVRTGLPGNRDPDLHSLLGTKQGDMDYESNRRIMQAVTDVDVPDPGPYVRSVRFDSLDVAKWLDLRTMLMALGLRRR